MFLIGSLNISLLQLLNQSEFHLYSNPDDQQLIELMLEIQQYLYVILKYLIYKSCKYRHLMICKYQYANHFHFFYALSSSVRVLLLVQFDYLFCRSLFFYDFLVQHAFRMLIHVVFHPDPHTSLDCFQHSHPNWDLYG